MRSKKHGATSPGRIERLDSLLDGLEVTESHAVPDSIIGTIALPAKDLPITGGALASGHPALSQ